MRADSTSNRWLTAALLAPTSLWFLVMLVFPLIVILVFSFGERAAVGGYAAGFTLEQYANLPSRWKAFQNTMLIAPAGTLLSLLVAYPLAYYLALRVDRRYKLILLVLVIVPFWTSLLVRTYAWIFILGGRGIPTLLELIGIEGVRLINTPATSMLLQPVSNMERVTEQTGEAWKFENRTPASASRSKFGVLISEP